MVEGDLFRLKEAFDEGNTIVARGYHNLKLKSNPFPPDGLAPDDNLLPSSAETLEKIGEFVRQFLRTKRYQGLVVLGTYGMGKTHTLKLIREQMQRSQLPLKAVYLLTPGYEPYQMLRGVLRELGQGEVTKWLWNIALKQIIADYRDSPTVFMNQFVPNVRSGRGRAGAPQPALFQLKPFGIEALSDYRTFLDAFDAANLSRDRLRDYIVGVFKEHISEDLGVVGEFTNMLIYDQYKSYASWQNLTVQGAGNSIFKPEGEATFLLALLKVLKANGFEYLMILIDEFEGISLMKRMTRREAIQYLYALRMLIDRVWHDQPFAFVLASTTQAWQTAKGDLYEAFGDRVPEELTLPILTEESARQLMIAYLDTARNADAEGGSLAPFSDDFFSIVGQERRNTPRQLVRLCYQLVERAVERGEQQIDARFIATFLPSITLETAEVG